MVGVERLRRRVAGGRHLLKVAVDLGLPHLLPDSRRGSGLSRFFIFRHRFYLSRLDLYRPKPGGSANADGARSEGNLSALSPSPRAALTQKTVSPPPDPVRWVASKVRRLRIAGYAQPSA